MPDGLSHRTSQPLRAFRRLMATAWVAVVSVLAAGMARADLINLGQVFVSPNESGGTGPFAKTVQKPGTIDFGGSATGPANGGVVATGDGSIHVEYGKILAFSDAFASLNTVTAGRFRDELTYTKPGVPTGASLDVKFKATVDGFLVVTDAGVSQAIWSLGVALGSNTFLLSKTGCMGSLLSGCPNYNGDPLNHTYIVEATVLAGVPAQLDFEFNDTATAGFGNSFPGGATGNFVGTVGWGGIESVTENGVPLTDYTVTSASGTDYTQNFVAPVSAVPEPSYVWLVAAGAALSLLLRRRF